MANHRFYENMPYEKASREIYALRQLCDSDVMGFIISHQLGGLNRDKKRKFLAALTTLDDTARTYSQENQVGAKLSEEVAEQLNALDIAIRSRITQGQCVMGVVAVVAIAGAVAIKEYAAKGLMSPSTLAPLALIAVAFLFLASLYFSAHRKIAEADKTLSGEQEKGDIALDIITVKDDSSSRSPSE